MASTMNGEGSEIEQKVQSISDHIEALTQWSKEVTGMIVHRKRVQGDLHATIRNGAENQESVTAKELIDKVTLIAFLEGELETMDAHFEILRKEKDEHANQTKALVAWLSEKGINVPKEMPERLLKNTEFFASVYTSFMV